MQMDKKTVIAIFLIIVIMLLTPKYMEFMGLDEKPTIQSADSLRIDSLARVVEQKSFIEEKTEIRKTVEKENIVEEKTSIADKKNDNYISYEETIIYKISTPILNIEISNENGGSIKKWELKKYKSYKGGYVNLIDDNFFNFSYIGENGKKINTTNVKAFPLYEVNDEFIDLDKNDNPKEISFLIKNENGGIIKRSFIIHPNKYHLDIVQDFENITESFHGNYYDYQWVNGIPLVEENTQDEKTYNTSLVYMGEELEYLDADDEDVETDLNGNVDWTAVRNKYFSIYLKAKNVKRTDGVFVQSLAMEESDSVKNIYTNSLILENLKTVKHSDSLMIYLGPLDYGVLGKYECDLEVLVMNRSWYERITRPIALLMLPIFSFLYSILGNYGYVIIVFSILLKLLLYPLTKKSYQSMKEMAILQPVISELREKYKDNPQKMNKELMGVYKKHGVNPMGGCLPNLLQMPILFAMFSLFRSTIQLRGQEFIFWITDLSAPDVIQLGFSLPFIGDSFHLLPILSSFTMIFQSMQTSQDPKNKALMYMMPVMMLFFLYSFPSGLHLYYFIFNIFSFIQQKISSEPIPLDQRPKKPEKSLGKKKK